MIFIFNTYISYILFSLLLFINPYFKCNLYKVLLDFWIKFSSVLRIAISKWFLEDIEDSTISGCVRFSDRALMMWWYSSVKNKAQSVKSRHQFLHFFAIFELGLVSKESFGNSTYYRMSSLIFRFLHFCLGPWLLVCQFLIVSDEMKLNGEF